MKYRVISAALVLIALGAAGLATSAELSSRARITRATAEKTALARVVGGKIKEGELEEENGKLVWSFDISRPGSKDVVEIQVDAVSGGIVSQEVETPADQKKEAAADKKKSAGGKTK